MQTKYKYSFTVKDSALAMDMHMVIFHLFYQQVKSVIVNEMCV